MIFKGEGKNSKLYAIITIIIIVIIILTVFSTNQLTKAYISDKVLSSWIEDIEERDGDDNFFGFEKWASITYRNNNKSYPAYISVTSPTENFKQSYPSF